MSAGIYLYDSYAASWVDMSYDIGGAGVGGSGASLISLPGLPGIAAVDGPEGQRHEFLFAHTPPELELAGYSEALGIVGVSLRVESVGLPSGVSVGLCWAAAAEEIDSPEDLDATAPNCVETTSPTAGLFTIPLSGATDGDFLTLYYRFPDRAYIVLSEEIRL